jgi:hypothetical protein
MEALMDAMERFKAAWRRKTRGQVEREIESWRKHFAKPHVDAHYKLHGADMTAPGQLADGMKLMALREVLEEMTSEKS